jgi:hypothetical protein
MAASFVAKVQAQTASGESLLLVADMLFHPAAVRDHSHFRRI